MTVDWKGTEVLNAAKIVLKRVSKDVAEDVMEDAKRILKQKTGSSDLLKQFSVEKSIFKDGGYVVWCQGPKKWWPPYRASFIELGAYSSVYGTYKREGAKSLKGISPVYIEAKPFMRQAGKKNKRKAKSLLSKHHDRLL